MMVYKFRNFLLKIKKVGTVFESTHNDFDEDD